MRRNLFFLLIFIAGNFAFSSVKGQGIEDMVKNRNNAELLQLPTKKERPEEEIA